MEKSSGVIEIDMFPEDVDNINNPEVVLFKELLEEVADEYHCSLLSFEIDHGVVIFSFDSDKLMSEIIYILQNEYQS